MTSRFVRTAAALVALASLAACGGSCNKKDDPLPTTVAEPPVPAPEGLLADVILPSPNVTWSRLQRGIGGPAGILPQSMGGLVAVAFGMDPVFSAEVDGSLPAFGVVAGDPADPAWALALRLYDVRRARGLLLDGPGARYTAKESGAVTELVPRGVEAGSSLAQGTLGITRGGYLLVARSSDDLARLGPYAARTLPTRAMPTDASATIDVPRAAVDARLRPKIEAAWQDVRAYLLAVDASQRKEHGGREPDYGDPQAIVAAFDALVGSRVAVFGDLERVRVSFDVGEDGAFVEAALTPATPDGPATKWIGGMKIGDAAEVLAMPAGAAVALVTRDTDADRETQTASLEKTLIASLGPRLGEADAKRVHAVLDDWTKARGETVGLAVDWDEPRGVFFRGAVRDKEAAARAVAGFVDLTKASPFKELLRVQGVTTSTDDAPPLGKVSVATITQKAEPRVAGAQTAKKKDGPEPKGRSLGLAWVVDGGGLDVSTGTEPVLTLRHGAKPDKKLGDEPAVVKAVGPLGARASTIVVAQPLRFDPMRANLPAAPVVLGVGRKDKDGFVRFEAGNGMLREVARLLMSF